AECGRIDVPTYYSNPSAGNISVGFVRVKALDQSAKRGVLFGNPGGPGGDAYLYAANDQAFAWPEKIRQEWDFVGVQPRGLSWSIVAAQPAPPTDMLLKFKQLSGRKKFAKSGTLSACHLAVCLAQRR